MNEVKIVVTAATAQAAADLQKFCTGADLGFKQLAQSGGRATESLTELRHGALGLSEGFRTLELGVYVLGGQRFPMLAQSVMGVRAAMMATRSVAILTGASLAAVGTVVAAAVVALLPTAIAAWGAYKAKQEEARTAAELHNQTLRVQAELLALIASAQKAGVADSTEAFLLQMRMIGATEDENRAMQAELEAKGWTKPAIEAMVEMAKLRQQINEDTLRGFEGERTKAKEVFDARIAEINALGDKMGDLYPLQQRGSDVSVADQAYAQKLTEIQTRENSKILTDEQKALQTSLLAIEVSAGDQRAGLANKEADLKIEAYGRWKNAALIDTEEFNRLALEAQQQRNDGIKTETELLMRQQQTRLETARAGVQANIADVQQNPFFSDTQKAQQLVGLYQQQAELNAQRIAQLQTISADPKTDTAAQLEAQKKINELTREQVGLQQQIAGEKGQSSFGYQFDLAVVKLENMNNLAKETAQTFATTFNGAVSSISTNLTKVIEGTETWHKALLNIAQTIINDIIQGIIQMGVRWVMTQVMQLAVGESIQASALALSATMALATSAIWATPATLATIATLGAAALDAPALIAASAAETSAIGMFAEGGRPDVGRIAIVGERGRELFVPDTAGTVVPNHLTESFLAGGRAGSSGTGGSPAALPHKIVLVYGSQQLQEELKKADYGKITVMHINNNKAAIGLRT